MNSTMKKIENWPTFAEVIMKIEVAYVFETWGIGKIQFLALLYFFVTFLKTF